MPNPNPTPKLSRSDQVFLAGVLSALAVVRLHGEDTIFDEIVRTCGQDHLIAEARRSGNMRSSGMADYLRRKND